MPKWLSDVSGQKAPASGLCLTDDIVALLRGSGRVRILLRRLGLRYQPEGSIYARTLLGLPKKDSNAIVVLKDGRRLAGMPKFGPGRSDTARVSCT